MPETGRSPMTNYRIFAYISSKLDEVSLAVNALNLWVEKTAGENHLNLNLLNEEKEKLKK